MAAPKRLIPGAGAVLAALGLVGLAYLVWAGLVAGSLRDLAGQFRLFQEEARRERDLEALHRIVFACTEGKDQLARDVAANRLSLVEGAARFRALCLATPAFDPVRLRRDHPGSSDEECYYRALIDWVRGVLADQPVRAEEVAWRLEAELQELLRNGTPSLPLGPGQREAG
jgi:hypothetical protein